MSTANSNPWRVLGNTFHGEYIVVRTKDQHTNETAKSKAGRLRTFKTQAAAQVAANKLNQAAH